MNKFSVMSGTAPTAFTATLATMSLLAGIGVDIPDLSSPRMTKAIQAATNSTVAWPKVSVSMTSVADSDYDFGADLAAFYSVFAGSQRPTDPEIALAVHEGLKDLYEN